MVPTYLRSAVLTPAVLLGSLLMVGGPVAADDPLGPNCDDRWHPNPCIDGNCVRGAYPLGPPAPTIPRILICGPVPLE